MEFKASTKKNRIEVVDALRGFALLGVLMANVPFSNAEVVQTAVDPTLNFLYHLLIDKKFISIFSMLFGFGFYIQMTRAEEKNIGFLPYFMKRMILLFIIGSIHCFVFWNGDIIMSYAVGGFFLLGIRKLSNKWLFILAVFFNVILTGVIFIGNSALGWATYDYDFAIAAEQPLTQSLIRYLEINWVTAPWTNFLSDMPLTLSFTFGNMLIGMLLGRTGFFLLPEKFKKLTNWLIILGLTIGIASSYVLHLVFSGNLELDIPLLWVPFVIVAGMLLQSMAYISIFLRIYRSKVFRKRLGFFNPVGKTALTNYLMQSVFYLVVFFHCLPGFNLYENISIGETYLIALVFFGLQSWISSQWLRRFNQGPFEYVWKKLSYKNLGPIKMNQNSQEPKVKTTLMIILIFSGVMYGNAQNRTASKVMFQSGEESIEGILVRPNSNNNTPAVVFQQGSGPHAFDGYEMKAWGPHKYYIEDVLLELGYAVLYCNKRGLGNHGFYQVESKCVDWDTASKNDFDPEFQNEIREWLLSLN